MKALVVLLFLAGTLVIPGPAAYAGPGTVTSVVYTSNGSYGCGFFAETRRWFASSGETMNRSTTGELWFNPACLDTTMARLTYWSGSHYSTVTDYGGRRALITRGSGDHSGWIGGLHTACVDGGCRTQPT